MCIALEDAYETLHKALLQLGPTKKGSFCVGETALNDAREALEMLQRSIVAHQEGIHAPEMTSIIPVSFNLTRDTVYEIEQLRRAFFPTKTGNDMVQMLLTTAIKAARSAD
jgi:hypothetical protein